MPEIILVNIGLFQPHIYDCIKQLKLFHHTITVITDKHLLDHFSTVDGVQVFTTDLLDVGDFDRKIRLDASIRNGFFIHCSKRLFYIHAYMKQYNKKGCIHIENDVMVYHTFETFIPELDKLWLTMSNENLCGPGILYIPDSTIFGRLIDSYDYTKNDMENLAIFFNTHRNLCRPFPIILDNTFYKEETIYKKYHGLYNGIFDAGAIGQYLGGVDLKGQFLGGIDPRNKEGDTRGFISNLCSIEYSKYRFVWKRGINGLYTPFLMVDCKLCPIFNLHIHSKQLSNFMSTCPKEQKFCNRTDTFDLFEKNVFDEFFKKQPYKTENESLCSIHGELIPGHICTTGEAVYTHRSYYTMKRALQLLLERNPNKTRFTFLETGCARKNGLQSTLLWDKFVTYYGGKVVSIDKDKDAIMEASKLISLNTCFLHMDSLEALAQLYEPIDFLYLDSYDTDFTNPQIGDKSAKHHLDEFIRVKRCLHQNSIILLNDTPVSPEWIDNGKYNPNYETVKQVYSLCNTVLGKGSYINIGLQQLGAKQVLHQYQSLWVMSDTSDIQSTVPVPNIVSAGRLCNNNIVCLAVSILAEKHDLAVEYEWQAKIESLGIQLFTKGTKRHTTCIELTDFNYPDLLNSPTLDSTIHLDSGAYLQTTFVSNLLYNHLRKESQMNTIVSHNIFKDRYKTNNDCFVHIRLGDIEEFNPGLEYYTLALSKLSFMKLYIATDSPEHTTITSLRKVYPNSKLLDCDEFDTIHFGSTCKYLVLSHGSFSALIGYMAFFSEVYYPFSEKISRIWYGNILSIPGWNKVEY